MSNTVAVAKFGKTYGIKGWLHVYSFEDLDLVNFANWYIKNREQILPLEIEDIKPHGKGYIAKIKNVNDPESAKSYTNLELHIDLKDLPVLPSGKYYWAELEGLTVIDKAGTVLGMVDHLVATGANDVLVIIKDHKEHFIPYTKSVVLEVDLPNKTIKVDWDLSYLD